MKGRDQFKKYRRVINFLVKIFSFLPNSLKMFFWDSVSFFGGKIFVGIRYVLLKSMCKQIGDNVYIGKYVVLKNLSKIELGSNVSIHDYTYIDGAGGLSIGDNVSIAHNCSILTTNHQWDDLSVPIKYNKEECKSVVILEDVWLGCGVRVLAGVSIKSRSIIAAGAVVVKDVDANTIYGGIPARLIKKI
ncbi:acyltransferase [Myroides odoratimimus]|uniref:acyltransferase n=1 Tax=Myroides odoratimimus TaxID=76832 RepID=UPI002574D9B7|nr:acyltransferase [Myroides odoratimimus]MDM1465222.1 acyltransferase [Myroides odoratimimus]MDM1475234.1 acyltransferase [Myroides odoratimimus]MDM1485067.1 acyltransferase [Myroides odoratimimus]